MCGLRTGLTADAIDLDVDEDGVFVQTTPNFGGNILSHIVILEKRPQMVTVHPKPDDTPIYLNSHPGQEYNLVVQGRLLLQINNKELILEEGDSIYFDSQLPHGMKALDGEKVCFLAVIM